MGLVAEIATLHLLDASHGGWWLVVGKMIYYGVVSLYWFYNMFNA
jgi:hypothetical protein